VARRPPEAEPRLPHRRQGGGRGEAEPREQQSADGLPSARAGPGGRRDVRGPSRGDVRGVQGRALQRRVCPQREHVREGQHECVLDRQPAARGGKLLDGRGTLYFLLPLHFTRIMLTI
jgi:hypothetical protein